MRIAFVGLYLSAIAFRMRTRLLMTVLMTLAASARADGSRDQALITYTATVGLGQFSGVSRSLEWSADPLAGGGHHVRLRVPLASFDSGYRDFDARMRAALEVEQHPFAEVEGRVRDGRFEGTLALRGVPRPFSRNVEVVFMGSQLMAHVSFTISLDDFGIAHLGIDPTVTMDFVAVLSANPRAVIAGGAVM